MEKRISSSSEECVDISGKMLGLISDPEVDFPGVPHLQDHPADPEPSTSDGRSRGRAITSRERSFHESLQQRSHISRREMYEWESRYKTVEKAEKLIIESEHDRAHLYPSSGNVKNNFELTAQADQDYLVVGAHIEEGTRLKIERGKYIDFGNCFQGTKSSPMTTADWNWYWMPVSEVVTINSFSRWEQAFCIYSNIYMPKMSKSCHGAHPIQPCHPLNCKHLYLGQCVCI